MSEQLNKMSEILSRKEDLHEDLVPYYENKGMFPVVRHPYVFSVPHSDNLNALVNLRYIENKKRIEKFFEDKNFASYIFNHERPYRLNALVDCIKLLEDKEYWELVADVWVDSENIWQNLNIWKRLLTQRTESKDLFMDEDDKKSFDELPDKFIVYRGYIEGQNKKGFSYTTDENKAKWFAKRYGKNGKVTSRFVSKSEVFAFTNRRNENEIIILK